MKTNMQLRDFVLVETVWFILLTTDIAAAVNRKPSNAVADIGMEVELTCTAGAPIDSWFLSKDGTANGELRIVGPGCSTVNAPFVDHYDVESSGDGRTCNLIVFDITMEQAGVYRCFGEQNNFFSILTVIENSPTATYNTTENVVVENDNVIITCSLNHNGSVAPAPTLRPYFYWTDYTGHNVSNSYDSTTENMAVSQLIVTAGQQDITPYTCHVYLQLIPSATAYYANNTPSVTSSAISPTIEVLYKPIINDWSGHTEVIAIGGTACEVGVLSCHSTGNPPPSYEWFDTKDNVIISNERTLNLAEISRNYTCVASNTIRNEVHHDSRSDIPQNKSIIVPYCRFPRSESTWISITPVEGCDNGTCSCSSGYNEFTLECNAGSYPIALYQWVGPDNSVIDSQVYQNVTLIGAYSCTAHFDRDSSTYAGHVIFSNGTSEIKIPECLSPAEESEVILITCIVIGAYILGNIIATVLFLIYYNRNIRFKRKLNDRSSLLRKMLPCMNDDVECEFGWIFLSVCVFGLVGIFFTICMIVIGNCSQGRRPKRSDETVPNFHNPSDLRENHETAIQNSTMGDNGYNTYEEIKEETRLASQEKNRENKDQKIRQNAKENWQPKMNRTPLNADNRTANPSSPPPNPQNEVPQHQKPTTAYGPVYSELLVANHNIKPVQYIEGNKDSASYSELKTT